MTKNTAEYYREIVHSWYAGDDFNGLQLGMPITHDTEIYEKKLQSSPNGAFAYLQSMDMEDVVQIEETNESYPLFALSFKIPLGVMVDLSMGLFVYDRVRFIKAEDDGVTIEASGQAICAIDTDWCNGLEFEELYRAEEVDGCGFLRNAVLGTDRKITNKDELNDYFLDLRHYCSDHVNYYNYAVAVQDVIGGSIKDYGVPEYMFDNRFLLEASTRDIEKDFGVDYDPDEYPEVIVQEFVVDGRKWRIIGYGTE